MSRHSRQFLRPLHRRAVRQPRDLLDGQFTESGRLRRGQLTPRPLYRRLIFRLLLQADQHALPSRDIRRTVERRLSESFTAADMSLLNNGEPRWVIGMQWERKKMVMEGLLENTETAGHGTWRLTHNGVTEARAKIG